MKRTNKYNMGYFEQEDVTSSVVEMQRWETLDAQISGLFSILGDGVVDGWNILAAGGLSIAVTPGKGHVNFVSVESESNVLIDNLIPSTRNYVYATLTTSSYWDQSVNFQIFTTSSQPDALLLGYVDTDANTITSINQDDMSSLGFITLINQFVSAHRHVGGTNNPQPVNLSTEVQGILNQRNMPELDASVIQTGTIDQARFPLLDHITKLINQGTLTHAQLDSFVEALSIENPTLMGETSTINLLQLVLALKHVYPDIDEYLVNEIAYIPGISPDSYVDWENTTAIVDALPASEGGTHTISGVATEAKSAYTYAWNKEKEFKSGTNENVLITGDQVCLETTEDIKVIDEFADLTTWKVITEDLSSMSIALASDASAYVEPPNSAILNVGEKTVEIALIIRKEFDAQDWSEYKKIIFYLKTENVQHGDIYFYLNDAVAGTQASHTKVLDRNAVTVNVDTLENGWQEFTLDISSYTRANINTIGFYISSQEGWDTSKGFDLNLDNIYLTTGSYYKDDGYVRVIFGNEFSYEFWRLRWDALIPTDSESDGLVLKARTRVGNSLEDLETSLWSIYTAVSGSEISLPAPGLYQYIEIEMYFGASTTKSRTAYLSGIYLDFYAADTENSFNYETQNDWESGHLFNIDTETSPGSILISNIDDVGTYLYGSEAKAVSLDENLLDIYNISGSALAQSTYQVINGLSSSLGLVTGVSRGNNGNVWLSDTDNDRILEMNKYGQLIRGFYGSFLVEPKDYYGQEDSGPGSNVNVEEFSVETDNEVSITEEFKVLHSVYNYDEGALYIVFNGNVENIYSTDNTFNINKIYLKIGTQRFYLNDSDVSLLGVDKNKYDAWYGLYDDQSDNAKFIKQFKFNSHVLKIELKGADKTLLDHMVYPGASSIVIASPKEHERTEDSVTVEFLLYNFELEDGNVIRLSLDGGTSEDITSTSKTFEDLSEGVHTINVQLVDSDGILSNIEAVASSTFFVYENEYSDPYITLNNPVPNQIFASDSIVVDFTVENFPILSTGQHLRYVVDSLAPYDYYSEKPITITGLEPGKHTIRVYCVDKDGVDLGYTHGTATGSFIIGLNSKALLQLYIDDSAVWNLNKTLKNIAQRLYVDVGDIRFLNIYSPIDIQVVPADVSQVNPTGLPSIVVAKLRSPSWTDGLGGEAKQQEFLRRLQAQVPEGEGTPEAPENLLPDIATSELIYGTNYLDGHSVVQLDMEGNVLMSNNAGKFAESKVKAKEILGSAEKLGDNEFLIGDSYNQRALVVYTDLNTGKSQIIWQFDSDRNVCDFHMVVQDDVVIEIRDDSISDSNVFIRQGTNVIWENKSVKPVTIYSGTTSYEQFQLDPDVNLYGKEFKSGVLQPGERYAYKFVSVGDYDFFAYPDILTGRISVTKNRMSSRDQFIILESDGLESPFSSRVIRVDSWGNVLWSFGESYLVKPRDARPLLNNKVLIST